MYGQRLRSIDGLMALPVATNQLGSTDEDHVSRGSINSWDLSATVGTPAFAAAAGRVSYVDCYGYENGRSSIHQGYGCAVDVNHGGGIVTQYAHCKAGSFYVKVGDTVTENSPLCQVGTTGQTSWPHLHFTILRNGSPLRVDRIFDIRQMSYCKFCRAANDPNAPVNGIVAGQAQGQVIAVSPITPYLRALATLSQGQLAALLFVIFFAVMLAFWLANNAVRVIMAAGLVASLCSVLTITMLMPTQVTATQGAGQVAQGGQLPAGDWTAAYKVTIGSEGFKCTVDPVLTMGGVTQSTYNAWLRSKGKPNAHVCHGLTEEQRKAIFYERYWLASGADKLPAKLALSYVDFAFNAGNGAAKAGVAQCGQSITCFNNYRESFYRNARLCHLYCAGWLNRLNRIRKMTEG